MLERFLVRTLINNLYKKEPKIDDKGHMVFRKSGMMFFSGIFLMLIYIPFIIFPHTLIDYVLTEMSVSSDYKTIIFR